MSILRHPVLGDLIRLVIILRHRIPVFIHTIMIPRHTVLKGLVDLIILRHQTSRRIDSSRHS